MANYCFIAIAMVQAIKKKDKKANCESSLDERMVKGKGWTQILQMIFKCERLFGWPEISKTRYLNV